MGTVKTIAIAGNPNVGKSTLFNSLTGLKQHTGNWAGKTVANAKGTCKGGSRSLTLVDIPGTYSLLPHSAEEEIARNFLCFEKPDAVIAVCDATCLERNLNLVLQVLEITDKVVLCVNLMDEAGKKGISVDFSILSQLLSIPVVGISARKKEGLDAVLDALETVFDRPAPLKPPVLYEPVLEEALSVLTGVLTGICQAQTAEKAKALAGLSPRFLALRLLSGDSSFSDALKDALCFDLFSHPALAAPCADAAAHLNAGGISMAAIQDHLVDGLVRQASEIAAKAVTCQNPDYRKKDLKLDNILTSRLTGYPVMALLLAFVFWLTISAANYPSALLSRLLFSLETPLSVLLQALRIPPWLGDLFVSGAYRVLAWVVAVMLPPMAIFFPLFTLLEDMGYLPRIAYNMDHCFKKCHACGKQSLTMCMGFGCNAAGVTGCRIIDSPRERLIAILTNCFVPCNGRFPTLIALIAMFFVGTASGVLSSLLCALVLTAFVLLGIGMTFLTSRFLSGTILKGLPSSFTLELPPYRRPQVGRILLRSLFDRTLFVLGRAAAIAAPAGALLWILANVTLSGNSLLTLFAGFLDPFARLIGLDGVILMAFILGFPANEIVLPIILMTYLASGSLVGYENLTDLHGLLLTNGWTFSTALCTMLFSLMHWPCSTTLLTIKKETGSVKWTLAAFFLPTFCGVVICMVCHFLCSLL